jgi:hypothetical protein
MKKCLQMIFCCAIEPLLVPLLKNAGAESSAAMYRRGWK